MNNKIELHERFWRGEGPCLILIPPGRLELYDLDDYPARFRDPRLMWESEIKRARNVINWPTDGIPTIRPNLGVITIPAMTGQSFQTPPDSMPWPGEALPKEKIDAIRSIDITQSEIYRLVAEFYQIHSMHGENGVCAYLPDTQGVFDIAHILRGDEIFIDILDNEAGGWFPELMDISTSLYINATMAFKALLNESHATMVHGHGTEQGVFFPHCGVRIAEDTAILLSPEMIEQSILPSIHRSVEQFGGAFLHFCGHHPTIFSQFAALSEVKAIDLGNPEKYDLKWVLECCAETGTVLYSRIAAEPGESWKEYASRIGTLIAQIGARAILRPLVFPDSPDECREMQELWHQLTS